MKKYEVESSNIATVSYDLETSELLIVFKDGAAYLYKEVRTDVVCRLLFSDSVGSTFHRIIKKNYDAEKVDDEKETAQA